MLGRGAAAKARGTSGETARLAIPAVPRRSSLIFMNGLGKITASGFARHVGVWPGVLTGPGPAAFAEGQRAASGRGGLRLAPDASGARPPVRRHAAPVFAPNRWVT